MKRTVFGIVALSAVLMAAAVAIDRLQQTSLPRSPASESPTAVEESGMPDVADTIAKQAPPPSSRGPRKVNPRVRAPRIADPPTQSTVKSPSVANDRARVSSEGTARPVGTPHPAPAPAPPDTQVQAQPAPQVAGEQAPGVTVTAPPLLVPPVLLAAPSGYPADGYRVVLEGGGLSAQLKTTALQGRVVLRMLVRSDGTVGSIEIALSSGFEVLDRAAVADARSWRFQPATRDGVPIDAWVLIPVRFVVP